MSNDVYLRYTVPSAKAVVLLSGGLDSTTVLAMALREGYECYALSFDYGQRHRFELLAAKEIAEHYKVPREVMKIGQFGGSALNDDGIAVPKDRNEDEMNAAIPVTYVPARNLTFLSFAVAWAEVLEADDIFIGVNALDYSGYPDCRPEFISAYEEAANLATKRQVEGNYLTIRAPIINMTKAEIIAEGMKLGVDYSMTHSCYDPLRMGVPCGKCDSCILRAKGFEQAGYRDPKRSTL